MHMTPEIETAMTAVILAILAFIAAYFRYLLAKIESQTHDVKNAVDAHTAHVGDLKADVASLQDSVGALSDEVTGLHPEHAADDGDAVPPSDTDPIERSDEGA